jgi:hypothetical protein
MCHQLAEFHGTDQAKLSSNIKSDELTLLNRPGLFALLKAKGISVSLPITNEELRAMARDALTAVPLPTA